MVSTNGTVVDDDIPGPQSYSIPLQKISLIDLCGPEGGVTFLTSNLFFPSDPASNPDFPDLTAPFDFAGAEGPASGMSTSAMVVDKFLDGFRGRTDVKRIFYGPEGGRLW